MAVPSAGRGENPFRPRALTHRVEHHGLWQEEGTGRRVLQAAVRWRLRWGNSRKRNIISDAAQIVKVFWGDEAGHVGNV